MGNPEIYRKQLGQRIQKVVGQYSSKSAAAEAAGITVEQLNKWCKGSVKVPVEGLNSLSEGCNSSFAWLCGAEENRENVLYPEFNTTQEQRIDPDVLKSVLSSVIEIMQEEELQMTSPDKFSELIFALHDYIKSQAGEKTSANVDSMATIIRLATRQG